MFERFTDRARKVMGIANHEAMRFFHEYIGTEHILLGIIQEGSGVAATVLKDFNIDLHRIREEVEKLVRHGPAESPIAKLPLTPRAKRVVEQAIEEARTLHHDHVGTEHLLLGVLHDHDGLAAQVLMNLGVTLSNVRQAVVSALDPTGSAPPAGPASGANAAAAEVVKFAELLRGAALRLVEAQTAAGSPAVAGGSNPSHSAALRQVLEAAAELARGRSDKQVGAGHVLSALLRETDGVAARALRNAGLDCEKLRGEVQKLL